MYAPLVTPTSSLPSPAPSSQQQQQHQTSVWSPNTYTGQVRRTPPLERFYILDTQNGTLTTQNIANQIYQIEHAQNLGGQMQHTSYMLGARRGARRGIRESQDAISQIQLAQNFVDQPHQTPMINQGGMSAERNVSDEIQNSADPTAHIRINIGETDNHRTDREAARTAIRQIYHELTNIVRSVMRIFNHIEVLFSQPQ